jgi:hypothetical protein
MFLRTFFQCTKTDQNVRSQPSLFPKETILENTIFFVLWVYSIILHKHLVTAFKSLYIDFLHASFK